MLSEGSLENLSPRDFAQFIDHTILKPDAQRADIMRICKEAKQYLFKSVCVNSYYVPLVADMLSGTTVGTCSVVGFPLGAMPHTIKAREAEWAVAAGAQEIDMVIALGALKDNANDIVKQDIASVKKACGSALLKVIIETCLLTDEEKRRACILAQEAGADFVKTSTGFSTAGAAVQDVELMRAVVGPSMGVKASGGIRTLNDAKRMIAAGANRLGVSASIAIVTNCEVPADSKKY